MTTKIERIKKIYANIESLEIQYTEAIDQIEVSQFTFSSGDSSSSASLRNPAKIREEINALYRQAEQLESSLRNGKGARYIRLRRNF